MSSSVKLDEPRKPIPQRSALRVGVVGYGTIGQRVVTALREGLPNLALAAIKARDGVSTQNISEALGRAGPLVTDADLHSFCDVIVDCAPSQAFDATVLPALEAGRTVITVNGTAVLQHPDLRALAAAHDARLILATGALLGLDAIRAAAEEQIASVRIVTRKPPASLANAPRMRELCLSAADLAEPLLIFAGSVREGAIAFPANVNVAAAIALAGIGADRTELEVWADPALTRNMHTVHVEADSARFSMAIENVPSSTNPATGRISALSVIAALRRLGDHVIVGS